MSTKSVTEKILEDARKEAQEILRKYRTQAGEIKRSYEAQIQEKQARIEREAESLKQSEILRLVSQARLQMKQKIVKEKRVLIGKIIDEALKQIQKHKQYPDFLKALILQSGEKEGDLLIGKNDWKKFGSELKNFLAENNLHFTVVADNSLLGGCTIRRQQTTYHGSLELIGELLQEELTIAVAGVTFKN